MRKLILVTMLTFFALSCDKKVTTENSESSKWCVDAHKDLEKLMTALKETVPRGEKAAIQIPKAAVYLKQCNLLPVEAQKCLTVSFARENIKVCEALRLQGDDKTNFEKLMSGKSLQK